MRSIVSIAMLGTLAILSVPSFAAKDKDKAETSGDKKICRREEVLGSVIPKRTCHTAAEWKQIDAVNEENADRVLSRQRRGSVSNPQG